MKKGKIAEIEGKITKKSLKNDLEVREMIFTMQTKMIFFKNLFFQKTFPSNSEQV